MRRIELAYTISQRADPFTRSSIRICRLLLGLAYTSHVAACLYVLVARVELGPEVYYGEHPETFASAFFPDYTILGEENNLLTNYLRCVHFAFTNLAGIGNHESIPYSALECTFTLAVNILGATFYAFTTGLLLSMIEPAAERANRFGDSAAALTDYMTELGMASEDQDRFIQGFILREIVGHSSMDNGNGPFAAAPGEHAISPPYPEQLADHLPRHLQDELHTVALVDAMKRRGRALRRCSDQFLTALASSVKQYVTLLPGDYIVREGENSPSQLLIVESGTLEAIVDGNYVRTFRRGDIISFRWVDASNNFQLSKGQPLGPGSYSPLLLSQTIAFASVRAIDHCKIATGLPSKSDKKKIKKSYPTDWNELVFVLDSAKGKQRPQSITENGVLRDIGNQSESERKDSSTERRNSNMTSLTKRIKRVSDIVNQSTSKKRSQ